MLTKFYEKRMEIDRVINEKLTFILDHPPPLYKLYFRFIWLTSCSDGIETLHIGYILEKDSLDISDI